MWEGAMVKTLFEVVRLTFRLHNCREGALKMNINQ